MLLLLLCIAIMALMPVIEKPLAWWVVVTVVDKMGGECCVEIGGLCVLKEVICVVVACGVIAALYVGLVGSCCTYVFTFVNICEEVFFCIMTVVLRHVVHFHTHISFVIASHLFCLHRFDSLIVQRIRWSVRAFKYFFCKTHPCL